MNKPLVSIILTVFKRTRYLEMAIRSVLNQEFTDWECIVTDDANTETAKLICKSFCADPRILYRSNSRNMGAALNVAAAFCESRGKYIVVMNDDDLLEPRMLQSMVPPLEQFPNVSLAFGNYRIIDQNGADLREATSGSLLRRGRVGLRPGVIPEPFDFALHRNVMAVVGCLFRKDACNPSWFREEVGGAYDYWLSLQLSRTGCFYFHPETVAAWRQHYDSASSSHSRDLYKAEIFIYQKICESVTEERFLAYATRQVSRFLCLRGKEMLAHWSALEARKALEDSLSVKVTRLALLLWAITFVPRLVREPLLQLWYSSIRLRTRTGLGVFRTD